MSRRGKIQMTVVTLVVAVIVLVPLSLRWHAQWQLSAYRKKLIAAGEKLTIAELAPQRRSGATNGALFLRLASSLRPFDDYWPPSMREIKSGVAIVAWREPELMTEITQYGTPGKNISYWTNLWPGLEAGIRTNQETLDEIRMMAESGRVELRVDYTQPNPAANYLAPQRNTILILIAEAILDLHQRRMSNAVNDLQSCRVVSELSEVDPTCL